MLCAACLIMTSLTAAAEDAAHERLRMLEGLPSPEKTVDATDHGVDATNDDNGPALRDAIAAAKELGEGAVVQLPGGALRVAGTGDDPWALPIRGAMGLSIRGSEDGTTELVVTHPQHGCVLMADCERVAIEKVVIDYDPPPFTQGLVRSVDDGAGTFDLELQEGFPSLAEPWFEQAPEPFGKWGMIFHPTERRMKPGTMDFVFMKDWSRVEGRTWRMRVAEDMEPRLNDMEPGDRFVHMARGYGGGGVFLSHSTECTARGVTIHASPGLAFGAMGADAMAVIDCQVTYREGAKRLLTTDADGVHCQQNVRGPIIHGSVFEGMADDSVNIYYYPNLVTEVLSPTEFRAKGGGLIEPGNTLQILEPNQGLLRAEVEVEAVEGPQGGDIRVTLAAPVPNLQAGEDKHTADHVYNVSRCGAGSRITDNVFRNHRRYAIMMKAPGAVIAGNVIEGIGGPAVVIGNDPHWPEGAIPSNVTVRDNVIRDIGFSKHYFDIPAGAAIIIAGKAFQGVANDRLVSNVTVANNVLQDIPGAAVFAGAARGVVIEGNVVNYRGDPASRRETGVFLFQNVANVNVAGNVVNAQDERITGVVETMPHPAGDSEDIALSGNVVNPNDLPLRSSQR